MDKQYLLVAMIVIAISALTFFVGGVIWTRGGQIVAELRRLTAILYMLPDELKRAADEEADDVSR